MMLKMDKRVPENVWDHPSAVGNTRYEPIEILVSLRVILFRSVQIIDAWQTDPWAVVTLSGFKNLT